MNRGLILIFSLILILGLGACYPSEIHAEVVAGSPTPELYASPTSKLDTPSPTPTDTPTPTQTPHPTALTCWAAGGRVEQNQLIIKALSNPLIFQVYTPPCYDQQPNCSYPVLYLIHGQTYTDAQWIRLGASEAADVLIAGGVSPFIIVMPREENDRILPSENPFDEILIEVLIPHIDRNYRTLTDREHRAIGGLSRGGNWAVHLGLSRWDLFGSIGGHSTPAFATDGPPQIRAWLETIPFEQLPRIYLDTGDGDRWKENTLRLEAVLTEESIPHEWHLFTGYHNEHYWSSHVKDYLQWYAQEW
ncbi:MAG: alpha/beta hydrolase-fold protein [Chloroflexota bacterium]|nr:alpha/beta hydrolase-fold protein [Chloroflexota bacterium]